MGDLTKNLSRSEFACKCGCGQDTVDFDLPLVLQSCQRYFQALWPDMDVRININSGNRCKHHNDVVGGAPDSQHLLGRAADFYLFNKKTGERIDAHEVYAYLCDRYPGRYGVGDYPGRTHFDTRSGFARWSHDV